MKVQRGFTLIELIVVIVILGILAATALPKFVDLSGDAAAAGVKGVAGGITSAASVNYSARLLPSGQGVSLSGKTLCSNATVNDIMTAPLDASYTVALSAAAPQTCAAAADNGRSTTCKVSTTTGGTTYEAQATMICAL